MQNAGTTNVAKKPMQRRLCMTANKTNKTTQIRFEEHVAIYV